MINLFFGLLLIVRVSRQKKNAEMRTNAKNRRRSEKSRGQDENMDDAEIEGDLANLQATEALVLERAIRSTPFSVAIWAAHILSTVSMFIVPPETRYLKPDWLGQNCGRYCGNGHFGRR